MNVGMASLYFASRPDVTSVHAFEPFVQTYEQGLRNFALNKEELASKIRSHNFGLGQETTTLSIGYDYENKGRAGIFGTERIRDALKSPEFVDVEICSVVEEISNVLNSDRCEPVVIKMDAEGAEYGLIDSLLPILGNSRIKIMMIEWHFKGPDAINKVLTAAGFTTFCFNPYEPNAGMIYATR